MICERPAIPQQSQTSRDDLSGRIFNHLTVLARAGTAIQTDPADELLTVADLAAILKCKESSVYNLTRRRGRARYDNPVPVLRLPMGLRFRRESVMTWLRSQETTDAA